MIKVAEKSCASCKWMRRGDLCLNPMNDQLFDWFNASTGEVMPNIRRVSKVMDAGYCNEYAINKEPGPHWETVK